MSTLPITHYLAGIRSKQPWLVMNAANKFSLSSSRDQAISHFYSFESKDTEEETLAIPDGCVDILFDCDKSTPSAEVFGTPMEATSISLKQHHRYFGIRFMSGVMPDFLNLSATELVGHHYNLLDLDPQSNQLLENIITTDTFNQKVALFGEFFNDKKVRQLSDLTNYTIQNICENQGAIRINALAEKTGYTSRTIQRQFLSDVGLSPKAFARIIRCQSAVYGINNSEKVAFSELAFDLGFSDQPHFLREFKKLVHATPLDYFNRVKQQTYLDSIQYF